MNSIFAHGKILHSEETRIAYMSKCLSDQKWVASLSYGLNSLPLVG